MVEAESISAGLDYPGIGPEHAHLAATGRARYEKVNDAEVLDAFGVLARTEGIIPALESAHALAWVLAGQRRAGRQDRAPQPVRPRRQGRRPGGGDPRWLRSPRSRRTSARARDGGRKLLVPYVTGGLGDDWTEVVRAFAAAGADAIEVGIPFSDPVMDGPDDPGGLRGRARPGRQPRRDPHRAARRRRRRAARRHDLREPRVPRRLRALRRRGGGRAARRRDPARPPDGGGGGVAAARRRGRPRHRAARVAAHARRPARRAVRAVAGLRLRREPARRHRRARRAGRARPRCSPSG